MTNKIYITEVVYDSTNGDGDFWDIIPWSFTFKTKEEAEQAAKLLDKHYKKLGFFHDVNIITLDLDKLSTIESLKKELEEDAKDYEDSE